MVQEIRTAGIDIIDYVPWGAHLCLFYQTKKDLIDVMVPYFKAGLESNEFCMWVTSEPVTAEDAGRSLRRVIPNLDEYIESGQIEILDYSQWYTKSGVFEGDKVLEGWVKKEDEALRRGFDGLRLAGNTVWLEKEDWAEFADYEATVDSVIPKHRMIVVCTYSLEKWGASEVLDVVSSHQFALTRREGRWVDLDRIRELVRVIVTTRPDEIACDECFEQLDRLAEMRLADDEIPEAMRLVQDHLQRCYDCHEEFEALLAAMRAPS
ncbi:MAG: MEDS domain-containing protein [Anaerolineae bacterium]